MRALTVADDEGGGKIASDRASCSASPRERDDLTRMATGVKIPRLAPVQAAAEQGGAAGRRAARR
jgi:hypothetical protein